jgi:hypothetical protein
MGRVWRELVAIGGVLLEVGLFYGSLVWAVIVVIADVLAELLEAIGRFIGWVVTALFWLVVISVVISVLHQPSGSWSGDASDVLAQRCLDACPGPGLQTRPTTAAPSPARTRKRCGMPPGPGGCAGSHVCSVPTATVTTRERG